MTIICRLGLSNIVTKQLFLAETETFEVASSLGTCEAITETHGNTRHAGLHCIDRMAAPNCREGGGRTSASRHATEQRTRNKVYLTLGKDRVSEPTLQKQNPHSLRFYYGKLCEGRSQPQQR